MLDTIFGLPVYPLLVHATVVIVPLAAAAVALAALWPRFRAWAGFLPLLLSVVALVLVPLSTSSGESLEERVPEAALVERHAQMAEGLLPWAIVLVIGAAAPSPEPPWRSYDRSQRSQFRLVGRECVRIRQARPLIPRRHSSFTQQWHHLSHERRHR